MVDFFNSAIAGLFNFKSVSHAEEGHLTKLPVDLSLTILHNLSVKDLSKLSQACRHFRQLSKHQTLPVISLANALFVAVLKLDTSCSAGNDAGDICWHHGRLPFADVLANKESLEANADDQKDANALAWKMYEEMPFLRTVKLFSGQGSSPHFRILRGLKEIKEKKAPIFVFISDNHYEVTRVTIKFDFEMDPRLKLPLEAAIEEFNARCARLSKG